MPERGIGRSQVRQIKSDAVTLPVYAVTFPRSVIGIDEHVCRASMTSSFSDRPPHVSWERPWSVGGLNRPSTPRPTRQPDDPLAQDAGHGHEDVEIISGRGRPAPLCGALFVAVPRKPIVSMTATDAIQSVL